MAEFKTTIVVPDAKTIFYFFDVMAKRQAAIQVGMSAEEKKNWVATLNAIREQIFTNADPESMREYQLASTEILVVENKSRSSFTINPAK